MRLLFILILLSLFSVSINSQTKTPIRSMDELMPNGIFSEVPDDIRHSKPYLRHRWFYEQRAYPYDYIPEDAYIKSLVQKDNLRNSYNPRDIPNFNWVNLGPTPGYYFACGQYGTVLSQSIGKHLDIAAKLLS